MTPCEWVDVDGSPVRVQRWPNTAPIDTEEVTRIVREVRSSRDQEFPQAGTEPGRCPDRCVKDGSRDADSALWTCSRCGLPICVACTNPTVGALMYCDEPGKHDDEFDGFDESDSQ